MTIPAGRRSGILVPLFSMPSSASWGIGEIGDIPHLAAWLRDAGQDLLQLLPIHEMAVGQRSPYSAMTAMAIDPIFISVHAVDEFRAIGGEPAMGAAWRERAGGGAAGARDRPRARAPREGSRRCAPPSPSSSAVARSPGTKRRRPSRRGPPPSRGGSTTTRSSARSTRASSDRPWTEWPKPLRLRNPMALAVARVELAARGALPEVAAVDRRHAVAPGEGGRRSPCRSWATSRSWWTATAPTSGRTPRRSGSTPRWARRPTPSATTGRSGACRSTGGTQVAGRRLRVAPRERRAARQRSSTATGSITSSASTGPTCSRATGPRARFTPADEDAQLALGEAVLSILGQAGATIIAEDLGTVPDFVRESLAPPRAFPATRCFAGSATGRRRGSRTARRPRTRPRRWRPRARTTPRRTPRGGTASTRPSARPSWRRPAWRGGLAAWPTRQATFTPELRDVLLEVLFASGSDFLLLPIQDVFGWRDRINIPADLGPQNWTWRLPWPVDRLASEPEAQERAAALRRWSAKYRRGSASQAPLTRPE